MDEEIDSLEKLEAWLIRKPSWWLAPVPIRIAQRILPFAVSAIQGSDTAALPKLMLPLLRLGALSITIARFGEEKRKAVVAANAAIKVALDALDDIPSVAISPATAVVNAAKVAAGAAYSPLIWGGTYSARRARRDVSIRAAENGALVARAAVDIVPDAVGFWQAVQADVYWLERVEMIHGSTETYALLGQPLWSTPPPSWFAAGIGSMCRDLVATEAGFELWLDHYVRRIAGRETGFALPPEQDLELHRRFIEQEEAWWSRDPATVNADIAAWLDELTPDPVAARLETLRARLDVGLKPDMTKPGARAALEELLKETGNIRSAIRDVRVAGIGHNHPPDSDFERDIVPIRLGSRDTSIEDTLKAIDSRLLAIETAAKSSESVVEELVKQATWLHRLTCWIPDKAKESFQEKFGEHAAMLVIWGIPAIFLGVPKIVELVIRALGYFH